MLHQFPQNVEIWALRFVVIISIAESIHGEKSKYETLQTYFNLVVLQFAKHTIVELPISLCLFETNGRTSKTLTLRFWGSQRLISSALSQVELDPQSIIKAPQMVITQGPITPSSASSKQPNSIIHSWLTSIKPHMTWMSFCRILSRFSGSLSTMALRNGINDACIT